MAGVGLVQLAKTALKVTQAVLAERRAGFSKKQFAPPQLLALRWVMRFEDWTYREAEVRLAEQPELRRALGLQRAPDHTTLYRFLRRLKEEDLARALAEVVKRFPGYKGRRAIAAVDATGLSFGALSSFFVHRRQRHSPKTNKPLTVCWLKWRVVVDVSRHLLLAQSARAGAANDCCRLAPITSQAHQVTPAPGGAGRCGI